MVENVGALEFYWKMVLSGRQFGSYTEVLSGHGKKEKLIMPGLQHLLHLMLSKKRRLEVKEATV